MATVALDNVGYRYPSADKWALKNINIKFERGSITRIIGRNGAGKSTLLKLISGLIDPIEGQIRHFENDTIVYMDQDASDMLASNLTIHEHFFAFGTPALLDKYSPIDLLASFGLHLEDRINEFSAHLSGGQRQILALATILYSGYSVLCLDEYSSALDDNSARVVERLLEHFCEHYNNSIILVSHKAPNLSPMKEFEL